MFTIRPGRLPGNFDARVAARRAAVLVTTWLALLATAPAPAHADDRVTAADRGAIEQVIRDQLDAFTRDDARRAFAHATPEIQRMFGTSDDFIRMVRDSYQPVYRSSAVEFVKLQRVDHEWVQAVQLVDDEGRVWRALFTMKRQRDKSWKVGGCRLVHTHTVAT